MNEYSLHSDIKNLYSLPGDKFEVKLGNYVVDILRGEMAIEVQTRNFSALKLKLHALTKERMVRLVYPLPERKWITYVTKNGAILNKRKSPKKGKLNDLFRELVMIPDMIGEVNFSLEVLFIEEEEIRCADGKGSWRRRGVSIIERKLLHVNDRMLFQSKSDFLNLLPCSLNGFFTNSELAKEAKIPLRIARQITYCLRRGGAIQIAGKKGKSFVFQKT